MESKVRAAELETKITELRRSIVDQGNIEVSNDGLDAMFSKLTEIKAVWNQLPRQEDLDEMAKSAGELLETLKEARDVQGELAIARDQE